MSSSVKFTLIPVRVCGISSFPIAWLRLLIVSEGAQGWGLCGKGWTGSTRGRQNSTSQLPTVNSGWRWPSIFSSVIVIVMSFIPWLLVKSFCYRRDPIGNPQRSVWSGLANRGKEKNRQITNKHTNGQKKKNKCKQTNRQQDDKTIKHKYKLKPWGKQRNHDEKKDNFEMLGTGIRTLGIGMPILVYCNSVFIDREPASYVKD